MTLSREKTLLIIDSHALIYRAYYAFPPSLKSTTGEPTNAVFGFTSLLLDVLLKFKPTNVIAVMDSKGPTIRSTEYNQYKSNRKEAEDLFIVQLPRVEEVLEAFQIPLLKIQGYEADDIIATIDKNHSGDWAQTIVVTGDRDLFQLVDNDTFVYLAGGSFSNSKLYDEARVVEKMGVKPENIIDYKGLSGDQSDNIPGVRGIGPKSACELINEFGTLENIYANIDKVKPKWKEKLIASQEIALLSKKLATVDREVPITYDFKKSELTNVNTQKTLKIFEELNFKSLKSRLSALTEIYPPVGTNVSLFDDPAKLEVEAATPTKSNMEVIEWEGENINLNSIYFLSKIDTSFDPLNYKIDELYFIGEKDEQIYKAAGSLIPEFFKFAYKKDLITFDSKCLVHIAQNLNVDLIYRDIFDVGISGFITSFGASGYSLKGIYELFNLEFNKDSLPDNLISLKNIHRQLVYKLANEAELKSLVELERDILPLVAEMERAGIILDQEKLKVYGEKVQAASEETRAKIYENVGHEFNIKSPKQLAEVLFNEKGLTAGKKTKGGAFSTNEGALTKLIGTDPIIELLLNYRELEKLMSTYIKTLPDYVDQATGRIHGQFDQFGAVSGRFSSKNPNLQNIPKGEVGGVDIRKAFVSAEDSVFISFDYSQQELRILAALANEEEMVKSFNSDSDIHKLTASEIFNVPIEEVDSYQRGVGKTVNFSVIYGISGFALSERLKIPRKDGVEFIQKYFNKYKNVKDYLNLTVRSAREQGYTETMMGRRRANANINSLNFNLRNAAERELFNFVIQGSAADIMKFSMKNFKELLPNYPANLLLQIHDEFLFEFKLENKKDYKSDKNLLNFIKEVYNIMINSYDIGVKYQVEVSVGKNWGELEKFNFAS